MLTLAQLRRLPEAELGRVDIAEVHFACAVGLAGAERIDPPSYVRILDQWTWQVQKATKQAERQFERKPEKFGHSRAYFSMAMLNTVLQRDLGICSTDKLNADDADFSDSRDLFLHGILEGCPGTCSTLPVLYAAIGRRLNYPIRLVQTLRHLFIRWDDPNSERFNVEATSLGFFTPPDHYYLSWPKVVAPGDLEGTHYLRSKAPREELSGFLIQRAYCLRDSRRYREAVESSVWSNELSPHHRPHAKTIGGLMGAWRDDIERRVPPPFPSLTIGFPPRCYPSLPLHMEREIIHLEVLDDLSRRPEIQVAYRPPIWRSPQTGLPPGVPERIVVQCPAHYTDKP